MLFLHRILALWITLNNWSLLVGQYCTILLELLPLKSETLSYQPCISIQFSSCLNSTYKILYYSLTNQNGNSSSICHIFWHPGIYSIDPNRTTHFPASSKFLLPSVTSRIETSLTNIHELSYRTHISHIILLLYTRNPSDSALTYDFRLWQSSFFFLSLLLRKYP